MACKMIYACIVFLILAIFTQSAWGWAEVVSGLSAGQSKWPRAEKGSDGQLYTAIRYCFQDSYDRDKFAKLVDDSWQLWENVLGVPGVDSGHSLKFAEFIWPPGYASERKYCYGNGDTRTWNRDVPPETLKIRSMYPGEGGAASATTGYLDGSISTISGRHELSVNTAIFNKVPGDEEQKALVAHEIGHIFGLWHEHQREDRDYYIEFNCRSLADYDDVEAEVQRIGRYNMAQVCRDPMLALEYGFSAADYTKSPRVNDGSEWIINHSDYYDYDSIMGYSSGHNANPDEPLDSFLDYPLFAWRVPTNPYREQPSSWPNNDNARLLELNTMPTEWDREVIVERLYGWNMS